VADSKFSLGDYVEVKDRIRLFYEAHPDGRLVTDEVRISVDDDTPRVLVKALAYRTADDPHPAVGWSWMELPGKTTYTKGSELENTETSAWGRAIGALGIGIAKSIASANEVRAKADGPVRVVGAVDGLIGVVATSGQSDAQLRETPDGWVFPFRLKDGAKAGLICQAHDAMAQALALIPELVGQKVTVWGRFTDESFRKGDKDIGFKVLHVERIQTPDWTLPAPNMPDEPVAEQTLSAEEEAAMVALPW
jgi:hypothetical protein